MNSDDWQSTPFILPLLLSGLLCGWVAYVAWRRRAVPGAGPFVVLMAALSGWALVNLVEKSLVNYDLRRAVSLLVYIFIVTVPGAWLVFAARFAREEKWLPRRLVPLLFVEPALVLALAFTNPYHGLVHAHTEMVRDGPYVHMAITHGPVFYVNAGYNYVLFAAGAALILMGITRQPGWTYVRLAVLLGAMLVPVLGNIAYVLRLQPPRLTDLTPVYFAVAGMASAWLLFRVRIFDVLPIARDFVLDCLSDAVFVLDNRARILDANLAARALVSEPERLRKVHLAEVLPELGQYLPGQPGAKDNVGEIQLAQAGAERFWDMHVLPLIDHEVTIGTLVRLTDVTERKRAEVALKHQAEQLKESDRRKDEFLAILSHELRNPLAPILTALKVLKLSQEPDPGAESARQVMERQVRQLARLVDDLLDVSRIRSGKIQLRKEPVQLTAVMAQAIDTSQALLQARKHRLAVSLPPAPVWLQADPNRLAQVFSNLLDNAAKYTEEHGQIWLTAEAHDYEAVVRVRDTGIGMSAEMLTRAFELFAQGDQSLDRSQGGLGIGLTLVRSIVQMHRGYVQALSQGPGKGTEFVVRLPTLRESPASCEAPRDDGGRLPHRRILVVDDNVDAANCLAMYLGLSGHEVRAEYDGQAALAAARVYRPEVVLLDIGMPNMNGYEVARRLRQELEPEKVLLVALTGYGQDEDRRRSREATIDHHMVKPVDPEALQAFLTSALAVR
jgi:signal transduction histidine kinase